MTWHNSQLSKQSKTLKTKKETGSQSFQTWRRNLSQRQAVPRVMPLTSTQHLSLLQRLEAVAELSYRWHMKVALSAYEIAVQMPLRFIAKLMKQ